MVRANPAVTSGWRVLLLVTPVEMVIVSETAAAAPHCAGHLLLVVALGDEHGSQPQRLAVPHLLKQVPCAAGLARQCVEAQFRKLAHRRSPLRCCDPPMLIAAIIVPMGGGSRSAPAGTRPLGRLEGLAERPGAGCRAGVRGSRRCGRGRGVGAAVAHRRGPERRPGARRRDRAQVPAFDRHRHRGHRPGLQLLGTRRPPGVQDHHYPASTRAPLQERRLPCRSSTSSTTGSPYESHRETR